MNVGEFEKTFARLRGWKVTNTSVRHQMLPKNMTPTEIIAELIAIEIEVIQRLTNLIATQS